ncbi:MAG: L-lactate dehydrogenase, partial [Deltaproteobacteria bacterium]
CGDYSDLRGSRAVVLSAGVGQKPGETRLELLRRNAQVFEEVVPSVLENTSHAILVVATNPVDVMTHIDASFASRRGLPEAKVIGTGTTLDTARFRALLGECLGVDPRHVHAHVIGEHGDSEVLTWSLATVGGMHLDEFCSRHRIDFDEGVRQRIDDRVRNAAYSIIEGKGATYYGIGSAVARITDVVLHDQRSILTVSTPTPHVAGVSNVSVSLPRLVGGEGVLATFPLPLDEQEEVDLTASARLVRKTVDELDKWV